MWRRPRTIVLAAVGSAALVPLFGDPRSTPVTHPLWARLLLRALAVSEVVRTSTQASEVFAALTWHDSLSLPADGYLRADRALLREGPGRTLVSVGTIPAEAVYGIPIVHAGDYQFRARLAGPARVPAVAEISPLPSGPTSGSFTLGPGEAMGWVYGGSAHLDPGAYGARLLLPPGFSLARIELAPPCVYGIEPLGGWTPTGITTAEDLAVTALRAMDGEQELAPAIRSIDLDEGDFQVEMPAAQVRPAAAGAAAPVLRAGPRGLRAATSFEVPEAGLYVLSGLVGPGAGQRWLVDGCRKAIVCPGEGVHWRALLAQPLAAGVHRLELTLGANASVQRVRIEGKKHGPADYVAALRRLGLDPGLPGPVSRTLALDAARFVRERRTLAACGDRVVAETSPPVALSAQAAEAGREPEIGPAPPGGPGGQAQPTGPGEPPIGPPILPPQPPATPVLPLAG